MSDEHDVTVVYGERLEVRAHGRAWGLRWSVLGAFGGWLRVGDIKCPGCSALLDSTQGNVTLAVPVGVTAQDLAVDAHRY